MMVPHVEILVIGTTCANFGDDWLRSLGVAGGQTCSFP